MYVCEKCTCEYDSKKMRAIRVFFSSTKASNRGRHWLGYVNKEIGSKEG